jgi:hypothetical protein
MRSVIAAGKGTIKAEFVVGIRLHRDAAFSGEPIGTRDSA